MGHTTTPAIAPVVAVCGMALVAAAASALTNPLVLISALVMLASVLLVFMWPLRGLALLGASSIFAGVHVVELGGFVATPDVLLAVPIVTAVGLRALYSTGQPRLRRSVATAPLLAFIVVSLVSYFTGGSPSMWPKQMQLVSWAGVLVATRWLSSEFGASRAAASLFSGFSLGVFGAFALFVVSLGQVGLGAVDFAARNGPMGFNVGPLAAVGLFSSLVWIRTRLDLAAGVGSAVLLIASQERIGLVAVVVGLAALLVLEVGGRRVSHAPRARTIVWTGATFTAVLVALVLFTPDRLIAFVGQPASTVDPASSTDPSVLARYLLWRAGIDFASVRPLLGYGFGSASALANSVATYSALGDFHSVYIQLLVELGWLGLSTWLWLVLAVLLRSGVIARGSGNRVAHAQFGIIVALLASGATGNLLLGGVGTALFAVLGLDAGATASNNSTSSVA